MILLTDFNSGHPLRKPHEVQPFSNGKMLSFLIAVPQDSSHGIQESASHAREIWDMRHEFTAVTPSSSPPVLLSVFSPDQAVCWWSTEHM